MPVDPIPKNLQETIAKCMMQFEADRKKPALPDPTLPQVPGYSHTMLDEETHQIAKCNDEGGIDDEFQLIEFSNDELEAKKTEFQEQLVSKTTNFLKNKYGTNFNRLIQLEISETSESGIGFEEMWRNNYAENLYLPSSVTKWSPEEFHLYIIWRLYYRLHKGNRGNQDPKKMSDLTIGQDQTYEVDILSGEGEIKIEDGETVLCLPGGALDNLTKEIAINYLAVKSLARVKLVPMKGSILVKTPEDSMTAEAKEKAAQMVASTKEQMRQFKENIDKEYDKLVTDAKGMVAKRKEEVKQDLSDLAIALKQLLKQAGEVVSRMIRLPKASIVTTPAGPGVAINAIITELDNLTALAAGLTALIEQIEAKMGKLELEKYSKKIKEVATVYATITNALSMAKAAVSLIGGGI